MKTNKSFATSIFCKNVVKLFVTIALLFLQLKNMLNPAMLLRFTLFEKKKFLKSCINFKFPTQSFMILILNV